MGGLGAQLQWLDAVEQAALVAGGAISAAEAVDAALERIEVLDPAITAVNLEWFDAARERAASGPLGGPFGGVPTLLKDLWAHEAGRPLTNGNQALARQRPASTFDTTMVARIRAAGLITLGRTTSPEFGSVAVTEPLAWPAVHNPWDLARSPGGSSGGAAAAVAAGLVPIAHASDGGGSIRIPASMCGLVGLKPSQGRVSLGPARAETGLGVELCVSRSVRDTAAFLDAVHGPGVGDWVIAPPPAFTYREAIERAPASLRIGVLDHPPRGGPIDPACVAAVSDAAALLDELGHRVDEAWPAELEADRLGGVFASVWSANMAVAVAEIERLLGRRAGPGDVEPMNLAQAELAGRHSATEYAAAMGVCNVVRREIQQWWADGWDLLLTPTITEPPLLLGEVANDPGDPFAPLRRCGAFVTFTQPFNISGQPAINVPLTWSEGLPIGVQLVAAYGREDLLLQVARQLEQARPWSQRHPDAARIAGR